MDLHLFLWLMMSICAILLLLENRRKDKIIKKLKENPTENPSWEDVTDKMEASKKSIRELMEKNRRDNDYLMYRIDILCLRQIEYKSISYKTEGLTTEQFEQATHNYLRRMGFTKERLEYLGYGHLVRLL